MALGITASAGGHELSARLAKVETAIFRNKTIVFDYYTMERDEVGTRRVDPYHLLFQGGQFYLLGYAHERKACACSACRGSAARSPTRPRPSTTSTGPRTSTRAPTPTAPTGSSASEQGVAKILICERIAWQIERHFGRYGEICVPVDGDEEDGASSPEGEGETIFLTGYSSPRSIISWVLGLGANARLLGPEELACELQRRLELLEERHTVTRSGHPSGWPGGRRSVTRPGLLRRARG